MSTTLTEHGAFGTSAFLDSIGICGDGTQTVAEQLAYLGINHLRTNCTSAQGILAAGSLGAKVDAIIPYFLTPVTTSTLANYISTVLDPASSVIETVEGPNEVNDDPDSFNGLTGPAAIEAMQEQLYRMVKSDPALNGPSHATDVYDFSLLTGTPVGTYSGMAPYADYNNVHVYGGPGIPPSWLLSYAIAHTTVAAGQPTVITETGAETMPSDGVDQAMQARYDVEALLDANKLGVSRTYLFDVQDWASGANVNNFSAYYGLYNTDGTIKLAGTAIHNLTTILADPGAATQTFTPGSLDYAITGLPATYGFSSTFEKSDGQFDIPVWQEPLMWNGTSETSVTPANVTITFAAVMYRVQIFDVLTGTSAVASYTNVNTVTLALGADPLIVEVTPTGTVTSTVVPPTPVITGLGYGSDTGISATDGITSDTTPTLVGSALAGSLVTLYDGSTLLGTAVATSAGLWALTIGGALANGTHEITAVASSLAGNSQPSAAYAVTVDDIAPTTTAITTNIAAGTTIHPAQTVTFKLALSGPVILNAANGSPTLTLNTGGIATYDPSESTATTLAFTATIGGGQSASNLTPTALSLNGAVATDVAGNSLTTGSLAGVQGDATGVVVSATPLPVTLGTGLDSIIVNMSEFAWQGDAQVTFSVDGVQIGGVQTVTAIHGTSSQAFTLDGTFGNGSHKVAVTFTNQLWQGSVAADRKVYVDSIFAGGVSQAIGGSLMFDGTLSYNSPIVWHSAPAITLGSGSNAIVADISENAWQGDAQFTISVDGHQIGGTQTATAEHADSLTQSYTLLGNFGIGAHVVTVQLLNYTYGGSSLLERTLYVDRLTASGVVTMPEAKLVGSISSSNYVSLPSTNIPSVSLGSGSNSITVNVSQDAYEGSAQFTLSVDGVQIGGVQTAAALHGAGQNQAFTLNGNFGPGTHVVTVNLLNATPALNGTPDRSLYVNSVTATGGSSGAGTHLTTNGQQNFTTSLLGTPYSNVVLGFGNSSITLNMSEDPYAGSAQFDLYVDGRQFGGTQTTTALHTLGQTQSFTLEGAFGNGSHIVSVAYINGRSGTPSRDLYINSVTAGGVTTPLNKEMTSTGLDSVSVTTTIDNAKLAVKPAFLTAQDPLGSGAQAVWIAEHTSLTSGAEIVLAERGATHVLNDFLPPMRDHLPETHDYGALSGLVPLILTGWGADPLADTMGAFHGHFSAS